LQQFWVIRIVFFHLAHISLARDPEFLTWL
jgi:hypothetical protein